MNLVKTITSPNAEIKIYTDNWGSEFQIKLTKYLGQKMNRTIARLDFELEAEGYIKGYMRAINNQVLSDRYLVIKFPTNMDYLYDIIKINNLNPLQLLKKGFKTNESPNTNI